MSFPEHHKCPPIYLVLIKDYHGDDFEEDAMKINAHDAEDAAQKAVEEWDAEGDYTCAGGSEVDVTIKCPDGLIKKFVVTSESRPEYYASEVV
jgi:hypothetical protein